MTTERSAKLLWFLLQPGNFAVLLLILSLVLERLHRRRAAQFLVGSVTVALLALIILPIDVWLCRPLEDRFPRETPNCVTGILVLGGGELPQIAATRHEPTTRYAGRYVAAAELARRFPSAKIVFSGGAAEGYPADPSEAAVARSLFDELEIDPKRVTLEDESRNTWQNIAYSQRLLSPKPHETWLLVTAAMHMPRAIGVGDRLGWHLSPWPTDFRSPGESERPPAPWSLGVSLDVLDAAVHEWAGLVAYRITGRTEMLFPAPTRVIGTPETACR